jgi:hypothetical protein
MRNPVALETTGVFQFLQCFQRFPGFEQIQIIVYPCKILLSVPKNKTAFLPTIYQNGQKEEQGISPALAIRTRSCPARTGLSD